MPTTTCAHSRQRFETRPTSTSATRTSRRRPRPSSVCASSSPSNPLLVTRRCAGAREVRARLEDLTDLLDGEPDLVVRGEEVRPEAEARVRPVVADDLARRELRVHRLEVRYAEDDRPAAELRVARRGQLEARLVDELDEQRRLPHRVLADAVDSDLSDDLVARARRVVRGDDGRAGEEARSAGSRHHLRLECERPRVSLPARARRLELLGDVRAPGPPAR